MLKAIAPLLVLLFTSLTYASDEKALLAAIRANPAEDTPRLIYADWLDEHGQSARAEFIRVQIELQRSTLRFDDPSRIALRDRANDLLESHRNAWLPKDFHQHVGLKEIRWERGFPSIVDVNWSGLTPAKIKALNELSMVNTVILHTGGILNDGNTAEHRAPLFRSLRSFHLLKENRSVIVNLNSNSQILGMRLDAAAFQQFFRELGNPAHLQLQCRYDIDLTPEHVAAFSGMDRVERIDFRQVHLSAEGAAAFARMKNFSKLKAISFGSLSSATPFLQAGTLPALEELAVYSYRVGGDSVEENFLEAVRAPGFRKLKSLRLPTSPTENYGPALEALDDSFNNLLSFKIGQDPVSKHRSAHVAAKIEANVAAEPQGVCFLLARNLGEL